MATGSLPTIDQKPTKLRWYQWRLRSLFLLTLLVAIGMSCYSVFYPRWRMHCLARRLNADPDILHHDHTPYGEELIDKGEEVIPSMLVLMVDGDCETRLHAETVIAGITMKMYGFTPGQEGWSPPSGEDEWMRLWVSLGNLDCQAPREAREHSVALWRQWLAERSKARKRAK
jgi:hypothetical protein